ncbi:MAG TPA: ABC transporter permease [Fimbriimonadales bacterium]|nr:ABC transporter permease [Fimbriimonadales bacterium]
MLEELKELWRYRELLYTFVVRELRIRYKNSVLGFFWSILNPLATVLVMTLVFKFVMGQQIPNYSAYILIAYLPYMFFQLSLLDASQSILSQITLLKKIYFPREILPLGSVISNFIHFLLAMGIFFVYLLIVWLLNPGDNPFRVTVLFLPVIMLLQLALTTGLALIVAALNTFYEDVKYLISVGLYLLFFLSPIVYFVEQVYHAPGIPDAYRNMVYVLYNLNPIAMLMTAYRKVTLDPQPVVMIRGGETIDAGVLPFDWTMFAVTVIICLLTLVWGYALFNQKKWQFVERP